MPVFTDFGRLDALAGAWDELASNEHGPVQSYRWARAWAEAFKHRYELHVVAVGGSAQPTGIAPLVRKVGGRTVEQLGGRDPREPTDLLFADQPAAEDLAGALAALHHPIVLQRLPARSPAVPALRKAFRRRGLLVERPQPASPYIPLDERWLEPERNFNAGRRSDFRRARRIAEKTGPIRFEIHSPAPDEVQPLLTAAFAVEAAGWKGRRGTALSKDPALREFYTRYASSAADEGILRIAFLWVADRAAAMQLAVESHDRFWLLKIGYDERFARCSPGALLMLHTVRHAAERELASFELLGTDEPWTALWTRLGHPTVSMRAYPAGIFGAGALTADAIRYVRKKAGVIPQSTPVERLVRPTLRALTAHAARRYVAGATLADVVPLVREMEQREFASAIGYWNPWQEEPARVAEAYVQTLECIGREGWTAYVSMKAPALGLRPELVDQVAARARDLGVGLHFDALSPEAADATFELMERVAASGVIPGCTLPARWSRSGADADRAAGAGWRIRLVKGQWSDATRSRVDLRSGFLALVDRLAGRARHVAVATHDGSLAFEALHRLVGSGTSCELELLIGLPPAPSLQSARSLRVPIRLYVPFGHAELPYRHEMWGKPRTWWWLCRDLLSAGREWPVPATLDGFR